MNLFRKMFLGCLLGFLVIATAEAKISKSDFNAAEPMTSGKLFMNQVDTVSLYLSTDHIVYAPRLTDDFHVRIAVTLLGLSFNDDQKAMEDFLNRHVTTFNDTLKERLNYFTPQIAKDFDADSDLEFVIQVGEERKSVGLWKNGKWIWGENKPEEIQAMLETENKTSSKKQCPALLKPKKVTAAETSAPMPAPAPK